MRIEEALQQKSFEHPFQKAILNLSYTYHWVRNQTRPVMEGFGLTSQQYNVLRILKGRYPDPAYPSEVKAVLVEPTPDLTRLINRLLIKQLVTRQTCTTNRRRVALHITEKGLLLLDEMAPAIKSAMKDVLNITEEEAETLNSILDKLRN